MISKLAWAKRNLGHRWHDLSHRQQHWIEGIVIGLLIEAVLSAVGGTSPLIGLKNAAMDATLRTAPRLEAAYASLVGERAPPALTFIDVDEATWRDPLWGEPYRAPRTRVAQLVAYALAHGASTVAVDILVARSGQDGAADTAEDEAFKATLSQLKPDQTVIMSRSLRRPLEDIADPVAHVAPLLAPSPLDTLPRRSGVIPAIPQFQIDRDGQVRSWHLWRSVCVADTPGAATGQWRPLPSVQLAAVAAMRGALSKAPWQGGGHGRCATNIAGVVTPGLVAAEHADEAMAEWIAQAGLFRKPWAPEAEAAPAGEEWRRFEPSSRIFYRSAYTPKACVSGGVQQVSALGILAKMNGGGSEQPCPLPEHFAPIVVIGQSADAAGDRWATPLGPMPGAYIIANAILSLSQQGPVEEPSWGLEAALSLVHIVLVAWAFAWFSSGRAVVTVGLPLLLSLVALNWVYLKFGVWIDYATPAVGIYLHRLEGQAKAFLGRGRPGHHG